MHDDAFFFETSVTEFESIHDRLKKSSLLQHVSMRNTLFALCVVQCEEKKKREGERERDDENSIFPAHMMARRKQERN